MFHNDLHFLRDVVGVEPHPPHDPLHGCAALDLAVVHFLAVVGQPEGKAVRRVVLQHIEYEPFLDGLSHGIHVKRHGQVVLRRLARWIGARAEQLQSLVLGRRSERDERDAAVVGARGHLRGEDVFGTHLTAVIELLHLLGGQYGLELRRGFARLRTVRFIGNHSESLGRCGRLLAHFRQCEWERLDGAHDDLLVALERRRELAALAAVGALDGGHDATGALKVE